MPKKIIKDEVVIAAIGTTSDKPVMIGIAPITQEFGGDMNILRDKINEIISKK